MAKNPGSQKKTRARRKTTSADFRNKVGKLAALEGSYMEKAGWDALVEAFEKWVGEEHIDEAIEGFLRGERRPTPHDVEREARNNLWSMPLADKLKLLASQQDCKECGNTGWQSAVVKGYPVAQRCGCPMGQLGRHKEKANAV